MLFKHTSCLWLNSSNLSKLTGLVRDFRGCTRAAAISPSAFFAHGPELVRCLELQDQTEVLLDVRLCGSPDYIDTAVFELSQFAIKGVTVLAASGEHALRSALQAARRSLQVTQCVSPPAVVAVLPKIAGKTDGLETVSPKDAAKLLKMSLRVGCNAFMAAAPDVGTWSDYLPETATLMAIAERPVLDYRRGITPEEKKQFGPFDILMAGGDHVLYDVRMLRDGNLMWTAELLDKEVRRVEEMTKSPSFAVDDEFD